MGPKVFISSTYYDLKYIREELDQFVKQYRFETILFENGDIGYEPGKALDESCYHYISKSDMVILIIGGLYGSPATGETPDEFKEYLSITRKEFQAANKANIPIYAFIDKSIHTEYLVYKQNYDDIENQKKVIKFYSTKDINVFRFIHLIKGYQNVVINSFQKVSDIKEYLANQWAGYFLNYLELRRESKKNQEIENNLDTLKQYINDINIMVDKMGKKLLSTEQDDSEYQDVKSQQTISNIKNIITNSFKIIILCNSETDRQAFIKEFINKIVIMMNNKTFYLYTSPIPEDQEKFYAQFNYKNAMIEYIKEGVEVELKEYMTVLQEETIRNKVIQKLIEEKNFCKIKNND